MILPERYSFRPNSGVVRFWIRSGMLRETTVGINLLDLILAEPPRVFERAIDGWKRR